MADDAGPTVEYKPAEKSNGAQNEAGAAGADIDKAEEGQVKVQGQASKQRRSSRFPVLFERAARTWWNPKFDTEALEREFKECFFGQTRRRFQCAVGYIILACCAWCIFFALRRLDNWITFVTGTAVLFLISSGVLVYTFTKHYRKHMLLASVFLSIILLLFCMLTFALEEPDISAVGVFATALTIIIMMYTVIPMPLYWSAFLGLAFCIALELCFKFLTVLYSPILTTGRVAMLVAIHAIGIHVFYQAQARNRSTFMRVCQSVIMRRNLDIEKQLKHKMIHSLMPAKVADSILKAKEEGEGTKKEEEYREQKRHSHGKVKPQRGIIKFRTFHMDTTDDVSILFADIVGFTKMSSNKTAEHLVFLLNDLFGRFDVICTECGCEKISTLGDCYYSVSGCPDPRPDHAQCGCEMGLAMCTAIQEFDRDHKEEVNMRVGVHTGTVLCGLVGTRRFKFDVWSHDVTLANSMESEGKPGLVHISESTYNFVKDDYETEKGEPVPDIRKHKVLIEYYNKQTQGYDIKHVQDDDIIETYFITGRKKPAPVINRKIEDGAASADIKAIENNAPVKDGADAEAGDGGVTETLMDKNPFSNNHTDIQDGQPSAKETPLLHQIVGRLVSSDITSSPPSSGRSSPLLSSSNPGQNSSGISSNPRLSQLQQSQSQSNSQNNSQNQTPELQRSSTFRETTDTAKESLLPRLPPRAETGAGTGALKGQKTRWWSLPQRMNSREGGKRGGGGGGQQGEEDSSQPGEESVRLTMPRRSLSADGINRIQMEGVSAATLIAQRDTSEADQDKPTGRLMDQIQAQRDVKKDTDNDVVACMKGMDVETYMDYLNIHPVTLTFTEKHHEVQYRNNIKSHQSPGSSHSMRPSLAMPRFSALSDTVVSTVFLAMVSVCTLTYFPLGAGWLSFLIIAWLLQGLMLVPVLCDVFITCTPQDKSLFYVSQCFSSWQVRHIFGAIMTSLPATTVYCTFSCELFDTIEHSDMFYCFLLVGCFMHYCNFTMLSSWMKSCLATLVGVILLILLAIGVCAPELITSPDSNLSTPLAYTADVTTAPNLSLLIPGGENVTIGEIAIFSGDHPLKYELILIVFLQLLLIWFLNRELEIARRLSFQGDAQALQDSIKIQEEKDQADWLLHNIIPEHVVDVLKETSKYCKNHADVGVIFAKIVNYDDFYDESFEGGKEYLRVLNELMGDFEDLFDDIRFKDVEKIKTIGACLMAASGLNPTSRTANQDPNAHLYALMEFSMEMLDKLDQFNAEIFNFNFELAVGFNYGEITAGVIGTSKLLYDIWGDTVNIASRMYSTGPHGKIQVTEDTAKKLGEKFEFEYRGQTYVKGKGDMNTYLLVKKKDGATWN